jgi:hypothetical protein
MFCKSQKFRFLVILSHRCETELGQARQKAFYPGMSGIVIGKKKNGTGRDGTGRNGIERDGVKL